MKSLLAIGVAGAAMTPCLWDSDTLDTELRGLPDAFDLVVGKWHRHSDGYYRERVARLGSAQDISLAECDDLAVAYEHLGERDAAVGVMERKARMLANAPDAEHQYRYHANLGTFYAHAGRYDDAVAELRAAVALNPDAHFGRELFQIELVEYAAAAKADPQLWRRFSFLRHAGYRLQAHIGVDGLRFAPDASRDWGADWRGERQLDWDEAYKAVAGMLRFGGLEGPELYRSLAELFLAKQHLNLAWWALERAVERGHPAAVLLRAGQAGIERHWEEARRIQRSGPQAPTPAGVRAARARADAWVAAFQEAEAAAIARGADVHSDAALRGLLRAADEAVPDSSGEAPAGSWLLWGVAAGLLVAVGCAVALGGLRSR